VSAGIDTPTHAVARLPGGDVSQETARCMKQDDDYLVAQPVEA
jgi:hypothetical protein